MVQVLCKLLFKFEGTTEIHRVTQTRTDQDRPGQTRTDLIKRTFGTLFGTLKVLFDQLRSFLGTKLDLFGSLKLILDQLLATKSFLKKYPNVQNWSDQDRLY